MRLLLLLAAVALLVPGCSILVNPDEYPIRCAESASAGCPAGLVCVEGECVAMRDGSGSGCIPDDERCDGADNDCDGLTDEGQDADGDGVTWCGGGIVANADCDDSNFAVFPGASEICDGVDNNCNGLSDENPESICGASQICSDGTCYAEGDCRATGCTGDFVCDTTVSPAVCVDPSCTTDADCVAPTDRCDPSGSCVEPLPLGSECTSDAACENRQCEPGEAIVKGTALAGRRFCAEPCCSDSDCTDGFVCAGRDTGAHLCVPTSLLSAVLGPAEGGAACTSDSDCLSGTCHAESGSSPRCAEACASDSNCGASGESCALWIPVEGTPDSPSFPYIRWICRDSEGSRGDGSACSDGRDCDSGLCLGDRCRPACRSASDCRGSDGCVNGKLTFSYVDRDGSSRPVTPGPAIPLCIPRALGGGTGETGSACTQADNCRDRLCRSGACIDTCCSNFGAGACPVGYACRPIPDEPAKGTYLMGCVR